MDRPYGSELPLGASLRYDVGQPTAVPDHTGRPIIMIDFGTLFEAILKLHKAYKRSQEIELEIDTCNDTAGTSVGLCFMVPMPPRATAIATLESLWGVVGSRDEHLFRDACGDFHTVAPIVDQIASVYIPYGVLDHRKAGLYTMKVSIVLPDSKSDKGKRLATASTKIALPAPQPWHKCEYLWPFIALCMTIVRADKVISRLEIRRLKELLVEEFGLGSADMQGLRLAMKTLPVADTATLLASVRTRMPFLDANNLIATLLRVACSDGPVNRLEHTALRMIAAHAGLDDCTWSQLVEHHAR